MSETLASIKTEVDAKKAARESKVASVASQIATIESNIKTAEAAAEASEDGESYLEYMDQIRSYKVELEYYTKLRNTLNNNYIYSIDEAKAIADRASAVVAADETGRKTTLKSTKLSEIEALYTTWHENDSVIGYLKNVLQSMSGAVVQITESRALGYVEYIRRGNYGEILDLKWNGTTYVSAN